MTKLRVKLNWNGSRYVPMQAMSPMSREDWEAAAAETRKRMKAQLKAKTRKEAGELVFKNDDTFGSGCPDGWHDE